MGCFPAWDVSLVHTGQFVSAKDPEKAKALGFTDAAHEFFALLTFVDRILLRVVGHAGMYMNYSGCSLQRFSPVIEELPVGRTQLPGR